MKVPTSGGSVLISRGMAEIWCSEQLIIIITTEITIFTDEALALDISPWLVNRAATIMSPMAVRIRDTAVAIIKSAFGNS
jgi:hypothetical protein